MKQELTEVNRIRKGINEVAESMKVHIQMEGELVDKAAYILIPSDRYVEVAEGIFDRRVESPSNILPTEASFKGLVSENDLKEYIVIFVKFGEDSYFAPHYHSTLEIIHLISGSYQSGGMVYNEGDIHKIKPFQVHEWITIKPGEAIIKLKK